jgi:hypothetical protein
MPHDPEQLANALLRMLQTYHDYDPDSLRAGIIKEFSNEAVGKLLDDIYKNIN